MARFFLSPICKLFTAITAITVLLMEFLRTDGLHFEALTSYAAVFGALNALLLLFTAGTELACKNPRGITEKAWYQPLKSMLTIASVFGALAFLLLYNSPEPLYSVPELVLNLGVPALVFLDYLFFERKNAFLWYEGFYWLIPPIVYVTFAYLYGITFGGTFRGGKRFPYYFADIDSNGLDGVLIALGLLLAAYILVCAAAIGFDRILAIAGEKIRAAREKKRAQREKEKQRLAEEARIAAEKAKQELEEEEEPALKGVLD